MKVKLVTTAITLSLFVFFSISTEVFAQGDTAGALYRYKNEKGVSVLNRHIPPEYAQNGYEILNHLGQVIEVIPPAPSAEELEGARAERELFEEYKSLKRRYADTRDIDGARDRKLININTNISILKGTLNGLDNKLRELMRSAADRERLNGAAPQHIIKQIDGIKQEISVTESAIKKREAEHMLVFDEFEAVKQKFIEGQRIEEKYNADLLKHSARN